MEVERLAQVEDMKKLLNGSVDEKLEVITKLTERRLARLLGKSIEEETPPEFDDVVFEVSMKRLSRVGQEGMSSYSQEGLTMSFPDSDFDEYLDEIDLYKKEHAENGFMKVRFL